MKYWKATTIKFTWTVWCAVGVVWLQKRAGDRCYYEVSKSAVTNYTPNCSIKGTLSIVIPLSSEKLTRISPFCGNQLAIGFTWFDFYGHMYNKTVRKKRTQTFVIRIKRGVDVRQKRKLSTKGKIELKAPECLDMSRLFFLEDIETCLNLWNRQRFSLCSVRFEWDQTV